MDLIDVGPYAVMVITFVWLLWYLWPGRSDKVETEAESSAIDLTLLAKEDYDFLRTNGLEVTQKIHDHFYRPFLTKGGFELIRQPLDKWGVEAIELNPRVRELAAEQRRGIAQQKELLAKARTEREYEELRPALIEAENAIRAKWIIAGNPDGEHVRISSTGVYSPTLSRRK